MNRNRNQRGFAVLELLLILVIVLGLGGIGWYVVNSNNKTNERLDKLSKSTANSGQTSEFAKTGDKFIFKEFGVQIDLPEVLKDMTYKAEEITSVTGEKTTALYLNSASLGDVFEKCYGQKPDANSPPNFAAISKDDGQYPEDPNVGNVEGGLLKQFDKFFISGSIPNGTTTCDQPGADGGLAQSEIRKRVNVLAEAFETATLVQ